MKILFVTLSNLGDVVLTLPVYQSLRRAYPDAQIDVLVGSGGACVFNGDPSIHKLIILERKRGFVERVRFVIQLRRERYDLAVDLRYSPIGYWVGAKKRNHYFRLPRRRARHRVVRHLQALDGLVPAFLKGISLLQNRELFPDRSFGLPDSYVVAAPGSRSDTKRWPAKSFAGLLDKLWLEDGLVPVLVGSVDEEREVRETAQYMRSPVINLCGKTDFGGLVSVARGAALAVTNDSAPLHIADALKIPVMAIFGPTDSRKYGPRNPQSASIHRTLFCSPCEQAQCRYDRECLNDLSVEEAYRTAKHLLSGSLRRGRPKILLIRLDRMGDLVLSFSAIAAVRRQYPEAQMTLMVRPALRELAEQNHDIDEVICYDYGKKGRHNGVLGNWRWIQEIRKQRFDIAFVLNPSTRSILIPWAAAIPYRIGFKNKLSCFLTTSVVDRRHEGRRHEADYTLEIVKAFGIPVSEMIAPRIFVGAAERLKIETELSKKGILPGEKIIALHPGASCASKRWPLESFISLARKIVSETSFRLVVIGGAEEKALGEKMILDLGSRAVSLTGETALSILPALLERCRALISNDSGPVHVAAAVGTPVLSLFGRNQAGLSQMRWKPIGPLHRTVQKDVGCAVCLAHRCPIEFECLKALTVEEVWLKAKEMIANQAREGVFERV